MCLWNTPGCFYLVDLEALLGRLDQQHSRSSPAQRLQDLGDLVVQLHPDNLENQVEICTV